MTVKHHRLWQRAFATPSGSTEVLQFLFHKFFHKFKVGGPRSISISLGVHGLENAEDTSSMGISSLLEGGNLKWTFGELQI